MILFWLLLSGCTVVAWLIGYGMGYLRGLREVNIDNASDGDLGTTGDESGGELGVPMPRWMSSSIPANRYARDDRREAGPARPSAGPG